MPRLNGGLGDAVRHSRLHAANHSIPGGLISTQQQRWAELLGQLHTLLGRLSSEHEKQVGALRAELARLDEGGTFAATHTFCSEFDAPADVAPHTPRALEAVAGVHAHAAPAVGAKPPNMSMISEFGASTGGEPETPANGDTAGSSTAGSNLHSMVFRKSEDDFEAWAANQESPFRRRSDASVITLGGSVVRDSERHRRIESKLHEEWNAVWESSSINAEGSKLKRTLTKSKSARLVGHGSGQYDNPLTLGPRSRMCRFSDLMARPSATWRVVWDLLGLFFLAYDLITIPLQCFGDQMDFNSPLMFGMSMVTSIYWTLDLMLSFFVGYHTAGVLEMSPRKVAIHYLRTWFCLDFSLAFVDWTFIASGYGSQASYMRIGKTFSRGFRVLRLMRIVKMRATAADLMERLRSEYARTVCMVFALVVFIIIVNHFLACGWYGITYFKPEKNWVLRFVEDNASMEYRYATALHWSLTQFTPASMEVTPQNVLERVYSVCVLLFAMVAFSSFISSITQAMGHLRNLNARRLEQQGVLRKFLYEHSISASLASRIWNYLHQRNIVNMAKVRTKEQDVASLKLLPGAMRVELRVEAFVPELKKHPLFLHYSVTDSLSVCQLCNTGVTEVSLLLGQELFGDTGVAKKVQMLFLCQGQLKYDLPCGCGSKLEPEHHFAMIGDSSQKLRNAEMKIDHEASEEDTPYLTMDLVHCGQWACEIVLWAENVELCSPFQAMEKCEILLVDPNEMMKIAMQSQRTFNLLSKYAHVFSEHLELGCGCYWRLPICNDFSFIQDLVHRVFDYHEASGGRGRRSRMGPRRSVHVRESVSSGALGLLSSSFRLSARRSEALPSVPSVSSETTEPGQA